MPHRLPASRLAPLFAVAWFVLQPHRTVCIALWDGEEPNMAHAGSMDYVKRHSGDWKSGARLPAVVLATVVFQVAMRDGLVPRTAP